jgi:hypothetical protein
MKPRDESATTAAKPGASSTLAERLMGQALVNVGQRNGNGQMERTGRKMLAESKMPGPDAGKA